jgi:hypothetical protein
MVSKVFFPSSIAFFRGSIDCTSDFSQETRDEDARRTIKTMIYFLIAYLPLGKQIAGENLLTTD